MSDVGVDTERFYDQVAELAVDGFTSSETVSIASIIRKETPNAASLNEVTPFQILMALMKLEAIAESLSLMKPQTAEEAAMSRAKVSAYAQMHHTIEQVVSAGDQIWSLMEEADRVAVAEVMGLDYIQTDGKGYDT